MKKIIVSILGITTLISVIISIIGSLYCIYLLGQDNARNYY